MNKKEKCYYLFTIISFICIIGSISFLSLTNTNWGIYKQTLLDSSKTAKEKNSEIEENYKNTIWGRKKFIDLYGIVNKLTNKNVIGNFEFIRDNKNVMHQITPGHSIEAFADNLILLNQQLEKNQIPFVYVQLPGRGDNNSFSFPINYIDNSSIVIEQLFEKLDKEEINYIDVGSLLNEKDYSYSDFYFKTDIHPTTEGEFYLLNIIADYLYKNYNIEIQNRDIINTKDNYNIISHTFLGNLGRSSGRFYVEMDSFQTYIPSIPTNLSLEIPGQGVVKQGKFEDTVMNGYTDEPSDEYTYWVTDYLQFTTPYYRILNHNIEGPNLLFIMDSMCMRAVSYLSLGTSNITIMDPRFFNEEPYFNKILEGNYDAVLICHENSLFFELFPELEKNRENKELNSQIVNTSSPQSIKPTDKTNIEITVRNTGNYPWSEQEQIRLCIFQDGIDYGYRIPITEGVTVNPGDTYTFILYDFGVSDKKQTYLDYQMVEEGVQWFGEKETVEIKVIDK